MLKIKKISAYFASLLLILTFFSGKALAIAPNDSFPKLFASIYQWIVGIAGTLLVVMLLYGGVMYITSGSNPDSAEKAKKLLLNAILGIIIVIVAYSLGNWVFQQFGGGNMQLNAY